ncbi:MAG: hypothetical protein HXS48_12465 [Theionarchaea archaeon]|nr:hypothetical protein [Theionarchaea archaeon]
MRFNRKTGGIVVIVLLVVILSAFALVSRAVILSNEGSNEFQMVKDKSDQRYPATYGNIVVWEDGRNRNFDIFITKIEFQITTDRDYQGNPAIYGDIVVWEDHRNGNYDIYGYNLSTKEEFQITTDRDYQGNPAIYNNIVVWEDHRNGNWDIYYYDLSTLREFQITKDLRSQKCPAICEYTVVWEDDRNDNQDIVAWIGYSDTDGDDFSMIEEYSLVMFLILLTFETAATLILSVYFFRDYILRRFRASLAWGVGFIPHSTLGSWFPLIILEIFLSTAEAEDGCLMITAVLGITLLYYGASLLFFKKGSFLREKMSVLIMLVYSVFVFYFMTTHLYSTIWGDTYLVLPVLKTPILLVIAILFFRIYRKMDSDDPSKRILLIVTIAWFLLTIGLVPMTLSMAVYFYYFDILSQIFPIFNIIMSCLQLIAWVLMVYSMVIRKVAMLTRKKRIAKDTALKWTKKQENKP